MSFAHDDRALAEAYHRSSELQFSRGKQLVESLHLDADARVLDVGCGTGRLTCWMAERFAFVVGIDPLEERIRVARTSLASSKACGESARHARLLNCTPSPRPSPAGAGEGDAAADRGEFVQHARLLDCSPSPRPSPAGTGEGDSAARFDVGRAEDLSAFDDATFDCVVMSSVLHWVEDKAKALSEARRVLRPDGVLAVTTMPHELSGESTVRRALSKTTPLTFARPGLTTSEHVALLLQHGFELDELHVAPHTQFHQSGEALMTFIEASSFGTFLKPVPEKQRASLRVELIKTFDAQRTERGVALQTWALSFVARTRSAERNALLSHASSPA